MSGKAGEGDPPDVSVIIPTYNRRDMLREAILSLFQQSYPKNKYEIIVVDNSSTDDTDCMIEELRQQAPCELRYMRKENKGPAAARNVGIRSARGRILAFTDSDCLAHPDWLKTGTRPFDNESVAFVSGQVLPKPGQSVSFFSPFIYVIKEHPIYPTNNILYRKDRVEEVGGFDERFDYPSGGEDADLAWRVKRRGWKNHFADDLIIYHEVHRATLFDIIVREIWRWRKVPFVVKVVPELRVGVLYLGYFYNQRMACFYLSLLSGAVAVMCVEWGFVLFGIPYAYHLVRLYEEEFRSPRYLVRGAAKAALTILQDAVRAFTFVYGSIRYRSLVL